MKLLTGEYPKPHQYEETNIASGNGLMPSSVAIWRH